MSISMTLILKEIKNTSIDASNKPLLVMPLVLNIQNILDNRYNENPKSFEKSFSSLTKRRNPERTKQQRQRTSG